jgi:hypothetical protein
MNPDRVRPSRTPLTYAPRLGAVALIAVLVVTASCSTSGPDVSAGTKPEAAAPPNASEPTVGASTAPTSISVADIAAAGLGVYADAGQLKPIDAAPAATEQTPFRLLSEQVDAELVEAAAGQGVLGADFDRVIGAEPGLPPPSFLVAGWVSASGSPGAALARRIMGNHDWTKAPQTLFPGLVLALYSADAARFADALAGPLTPSPSDTTAPSDTAAPAETTRPAGFRATVALSLRTIGVCSRVKGFVDNMVGAMFDALGHLQAPEVPSTGNNVLDFFGSGIQAGLNLATGVVNGLIDAGRFLVVNGIKLAVQPILNEVAKAAAALAVVATITGLLRPWTVRLTATPPSTRKAVGDEPGLAGTVGATVDLGGLDEWPADVADCAQTAGVTLPPLKPEGAPIVWTFDQSPGDLAVQDLGTATVLDANAHAELAYTTTQEDTETASGEERTGVLTVRASIRRKEIADFQQTISNVVTAQIPTLLRPTLTALLGPTLNAVLGALPAFLDSTIQIPIGVVYHDESTTTTSSPPTTGCSAGSTSIPSGTFTGVLAGDLQITEPPIVGHTDETFTGQVVVISDGESVTGTIAMHWSGSGDFNNGHVTEDSTLHDATITGSATDPVVDGTMTGQVVVDGDARAGSSPVHLHLHILSADCQTITGDAVAMLREILPGTVVSMNGNGTWTAAR